MLPYMLWHDSSPHLPIFTLPAFPVESFKAESWHDCRFTMMNISLLNFACVCLLSCLKVDYPLFPVTLCRLLRADGALHESPPDLHKEMQKQLCVSRCTAFPKEDV